MTEILLTASGISKRFIENGVLAVDEVDLEMGAGVHAVVGENGAGKSTLMHILAGALKADTGEIRVSGNEVRAGSSADALAAGIVMSFQHPRLVGSLAVWENLVLGSEPTRAFLIDRKSAIAEITDRSFGHYGIDLNARLANLSSGQTRLVSLLAAILRLPAGGQGVLILDEPTAACSPSESVQIMAAMRRTAKAGHAVAFITHRIPEVEEIADDVTVMKGGRVVAKLGRPFTTNLIAREMFGADGTSRVARGSDERRAAIPAGGDAVLEVKNVSLTDGDRIRLQEVSFVCHEGEILGLTGSRQSGIEAVEEILGAMRSPQSGEILFRGKRILGKGPRELRSLGIGYVPTDRLLRGASLDSSVAENLIVLERRQLQRAGVFVAGQVNSYGNRVSRDFDIDAYLQTPLRRLSGGNIQKVILGRELAEQLELLIICEPGWGLDLEAQRMIMDRIRQAAADGAAVIVISTDIDEVLGIADTVAAFNGAGISDLLPASSTSREQLGQLVFGSESGANDA